MSAEPKNRNENTLGLTYDYSYSGADCNAYAFFPGAQPFISSLIGTEPSDEKAKEAWKKKEAVLNKAKEPVLLTSMATISLSIHEAKSPVRRLGERGISGVSRSLRTIAGSIVFLVLKDHPLRELAIKDPANFYPELIGYSRDLNYRGVGGISGFDVKKDNKMVNKISSLISPFNIVLNYSTEVNVKDEIASLMIEGVEIVTEGIVTSVNDMVSEVVVQFIAQNVVTLTHSGSENINDIIGIYEKNNDSFVGYKGYYQGLVKKYEKFKVPERSSFGTQINIEGYKL